ncbi:MAG: SPFH/Band 7/PHB domain protein [Armatimonadetes bacterium]|nr:SPFH/Band 7/PHB domain protein [Armatimonadota bacterium]
MGDFFGAFFWTFILCFPFMAMMSSIAKFLGLFVVVEERECRVYVLFGKVIGILREPGLYFLPFVLGPMALVVHFLGQCFVVDVRLDQEYLRSQPVNSEEGAPMGIGVWYEAYVSDPEAYLFKNNDPRGSLRANVSSATVRCLSNMKLGDMLENRHEMSRTVRTEVSPQSHEWGFRLGSVYIRKVHFRDRGMIHQIEEKVVNRLRQVTAAIRQDGTNQVNLIASSAERQAAVEFARAQAVRPQIVGSALQEIADKDADVARALFEILEIQKLLQSESNITLLPPSRGDFMAPLLAAWLADGHKAAPPPPKLMKH